MLPLAMDAALVRFRRLVAETVAAERSAGAAARRRAQASPAARRAARSNRLAASISVATERSSGERDRPETS